MNVPDRLHLTAETWQEHFRHRSYFVLLGEFLPRSFAQRDVRLDPAATWEEIAQLLPGFQEFDLEIGRWRWRMALKRGGQVIEIDSSRGKAHVEALCDSHAALEVIEEVCKALESKAPPLHDDKNEGVWADFCLLGQGREDLFLITFNEEVDQIDPAFLRPGRCVAHVRFPLLPRSAATEWLRLNGRATADLGDATSLADLYSQAGGGPIRDEGDEAMKGPKGFGVKRKEGP